MRHVSATETASTDWSIAITLETKDSLMQHILRAILFWICKWTKSISSAWQYMLSKQSSCDNAGIGQCKKQNEYHFLWLSKITTESFKHRGSKNLATKN